MDVFTSLRHLADQLGVAVDWSRLHAHATSAAVIAFVARAARVSYATSIQQIHGEQIGDALDAAAGAAGTADTDVPALPHSISIDQGDRRDQAITEARALLGDLINLGVLR
jgi:hypothetical protein